jgi:hypothetical protein
MKDSIYTIVNQTRLRPTCIAVPSLTALFREPVCMYINIYIYIYIYIYDWPDGRTHTLAVIMRVLNDLCPPLKFEDGQPWFKISVS